MPHLLVHRMKNLPLSRSWSNIHTATVAAQALTVV